MTRRRRAITGWAAVALAPLALPLALLAGFIRKKRDMSAADVAERLRNFIDAVGGERDWDDFESAELADADLDRIRREAALAGPPNPDFDKLRELLKQAEAKTASSPSPQMN